jgi:hypothetical protein
MTIELSAGKGFSMLIDEPDTRRDFLEYSYSSQEGSTTCRRRVAQVGETAVRPVRLVLLLLVGPRQGENDVLEFASVEDAVAYGRQLFGDPQFQLEGIEDANGKSVVGYDFLNDLCCGPPTPKRRYG